MNPRLRGDKLKTNLLSNENKSAKLWHDDGDDDDDDDGDDDDDDGGNDDDDDDYDDDDDDTGGTNCSSEGLNVATEQVTYRLRTEGITGWKLWPDPGYPEWDSLCALRVMSGKQAGCPEIRHGSVFVYLPYYLLIITSVQANSP